MMHEKSQAHIDKKKEILKKAGQERSNQSAREAGGAKFQHQQTSNPQLDEIKRINELA